MLGHTDELEKIGFACAGLSDDEGDVVEEAIFEDDVLGGVGSASLDEEAPAGESASDFIGEINPLVADIPKSLYIDKYQLHRFVVNRFLDKRLTC